MSDNPNPEITWSVPMAQANHILDVLGRQPYNEIAPLVMFLRRQADAQIQLLQQQQGVGQQPQANPPRQDVKT